MVAFKVVVQIGDMARTHNWVDARSIPNLPVEIECKRRFLVISPEQSDDEQDDSAESPTPFAKPPSSDQKGNFGAYEVEEDDVIDPKSFPEMEDVVRVYMSRRVVH